MAPFSLLAALSLVSAAIAAPAEVHQRQAPQQYTTTPPPPRYTKPPQSTTTRKTTRSVSTTTTPVVSRTTTTTSPTTTTTSASNTNPTTTLLATATSKNYGLNDAAKAAGKLWFGTAIDYPGTGEGSDPYYLAAFNNTHDFGEATPANIMKFVSTEPQQNVFDFTGAEQFLALAQGTNKAIRCHNLIWGNQLSDWVTNPSTPWTNATLSAALKNHVQTLVAHFGDRCAEWDVVNEAFADSPAGSFTPNIWYNIIGPTYVDQAFAAAQETIRENNLKVKLFYNDYNIEYPGPKSTAAQSLVRSLKSQGIQIDGVGLESHFIVGSTPSQADQEANMRAFAALGVNVVVTELDIRTDMPPSAEVQQQQVQDYYNTVAACMNVAECVGMVVWDFVDTYSWIPYTFAGEGYGTPFLQPQGANGPIIAKAAYDGILNALQSS